MGILGFLHLYSLIKHLKFQLKLANATLLHESFKVSLAHLGSQWIEVVCGSGKQIYSFSFMSGYYVRTEWWLFFQMEKVFATLFCSFNVSLPAHSIWYLGSRKFFILRDGQAFNHFCPELWNIISVKNEGQAETKDMHELCSLVL